MIFIVGGLFMYIVSFAQIQNVDPHWQLKWEDHFNSFDNSKWIKMEYGRHGEEPQLYRNNNVWVYDGTLVLQVNNNATYCPDPAPDPTSWSCGRCESGIRYNYTSGWIETKSSYDFKFGYIEARIRFPYETGWGFKPAFWTWRRYDKNLAKNEAEIDICEINPYDLSNIFETNIHTTYDYNEEYNQKHPVSNSNYTGWHIYGVEWDPNRIIWYLDGKIIRVFDNHGITDPVRVILNLPIAKNFTPPTSQSFQKYMYVDYVKVYGLKYDCRRTVVEIPSFSNYNYAVKKSISLSGATSIPSNSNICLRATDFIELKDGFEVPLGTEMYFDISPCEDNSIGINDPLPPEY
jgi:beta-glucanase (GH16 family)